MLEISAFLVDQVQQSCYKAYQQAKKKTRTYAIFCMAMKTLFKYLKLNNWKSFFTIITQGKLS